MSGMYKLIAELDDEFEEYEFYGDDNTDATFEAMAHVMNTAMESELWAKGGITLYNPNGFVIRTMEAKA